MSGSTTKKVLLDRFDRAVLRGFVNPQAFLLPEGVELLRPDGSVVAVPYPQVKAISFVRNLDGASVFAERTTFLARPKSAGLWVELAFRDGDKLQGILSNDLLQFESSGLTITPPEVAGNTQRVFVHRTALLGATVLGVIGSPLRLRRGKPVETGQIRLFEE